jgi:hypothetical protein
MNGHVVQYFLGLRTNVRRAYAEFQPTFIENHGREFDRDLNYCVIPYAVQILLPL